MKKFLLKKKIKIAFEPLLIKLVSFVKNLFKLIFTKRTILFITNQKIRSVTFGPFSQAFCYIAIAWIINLFIQSLNYDKIISEKSSEITKLKIANSYFFEEFQTVNDKLKKVNEYLNIINGSVQDVDYKPNIIKQKNIDESNLSKKDKYTLNEIKDSYQNLNLLTETTGKRIAKIEKAILNTGLSIKRPAIKMPNQPKRTYSLNDKTELSKIAQGGPMSYSDNEIEYALNQKKINSSMDRELEKAKFNSDIEYLIVLEKLVKSLPLSRPMKNYYISSGFGYRIDPITRVNTPHRGLDFVGVNREKVLSPSPGKVVLARWFSDYGNAVVIDHGYGVTSRYGHLAEIKVSEGQKLKTGDVIGNQGNTGRSTGSHLHYEVRYRNIPLDPKKFIEAGNYLIPNNTIPKYVDI